VKEAAIDMTATRGSKLWRFINWGLIVAFVVALLPATALPGAAQLEDTAMTIIVMPAAIDASAAAMGEQSARIANEVVLEITAAPDWAATNFNPNSADVQRAIKEGRILAPQIDLRSMNPRNAIQIAHAMELDGALLITASEYVTSGTQAGQLTLTGELYWVEPNFNAQSETAVENPQPAAVPVVIGSYEEMRPARVLSAPQLRLEVLVKAAAELARAITGEEEEEAAAPRRGPRIGSTTLIAILLLGLAVFALTDEGGDDPVGGLRVPIPEAIQTHENGFRLLWSAPPAGIVDLVRYEIGRSIDGGPFVRIDQGLTGPDTTEYFDPDLVAGDYRYRIRAVYADQSASQYAYFDTVRFIP
jgi:hypothetical protein